VTITSQGDGDKVVEKGDKIKAHYSGTLLDGTKFDASYDRGQPLPFVVGQG
jgi:FKBP-type peptidyl-prolyl cis-trans isomerase